MDFKEHTTPEKLERYGFLWSQIRLIIASLSLMIGGFPLILKLPFFTVLFNILLVWSWRISGVVTGYLIYRFIKNDQNIFGGKDNKDLGTFFVMLISGINLGIAGLFMSNFGMNLFPYKILYFLTGIIYLVSAYHLNKRWKEYGEKLF